MDRTRYTVWCILSAAAALAPGCDTPAPPAKPLAQVASRPPQLLGAENTTGERLKPLGVTRVVPAAYPSESDQRAWAPDDAAIRPLTSREREAVNPLRTPAPAGESKRPVALGAAPKQHLVAKAEEESSDESSAAVESAEAEQTAPDERTASVEPSAPIQRTAPVERTAPIQRIAPVQRIAPAEVSERPIAAPLPLVDIEPSQAVEDAVLPQARPLAAVRDRRPLKDAAPILAASAPVSATNSPAASNELPWARTHARGAEMNAVLAGADEFTRNGFDLARRGALYSARARFIQALQLIAQAQDAEQETRLYTKALAAGLTSMKESGDFVARNSADREIDLPFVVNSHQTPILKNQSLSDTTAVAALRRYYTYSQEQLAVAAGTEPAGSMALYGLGRLMMVRVRPGDANEIERTAQAMVYYQAALLANDRNFRASNELGVLLVKCGKPERAKEMFLRSLAVSPQPVVWQNLAKVHERLGETKLAASARNQMHGKDDATSDFPAVTWVNSSTFAQSTPASDGLTPPAAAPANGAAATTAAPAPQPTAAKKSVSEWFPWNRPAQR